MKRAKPFIDKIISNIISKKWLVWIVCTIMVSTGTEISDNYMWVSLTFIGFQTGLDAYTKFIKAKGGSYISDGTDSLDQ